MNIAIIHFGALQPGGYPADTRALASALSDHGHEVTVITEPGRRTDGLGTARVASPQWSTRLRGFDLIHLMGLMRFPQIAYVFKAFPATTPLVISPLTQLTTEHLKRSNKRKRIYFMLLRKMLQKRAFCVHGFSDLELTEVQRFLSPVGTFVAQSGVFAAPGNAWTGGGGYILFFGRNDIHQKGLDLLLDGYSQYTATGGRTPLLVAGEPWRSSERFLARTAGSGVRLRGRVSDEEKWTLLHQTRLLLFLSRWDGPPRPVREAISVGCPVAVTSGTHMTDFVKKYGAGQEVLFDPDSVMETIRTSDDNAALAAWSKGAVELRARLSWPQIAKDYERGYEYVVEVLS